MLKKGMKISKEFKVNETDTAKAIGSGTLEVLATPRIVQLVENLAVILLKNHLEELDTTVGSYIEINHTSPTFMNRSFKIEVTLEKIEGNKLSFSFIANDEAGEIAKGKHTRYIVNKGNFLLKASLK